MQFRKEKADSETKARIPKIIITCGPDASTKAQSLLFLYPNTNALEISHQMDPSAVNGTEQAVQWGGSSGSTLSAMVIRGHHLPNSSCDYFCRHHQRWKHKSAANTQVNRLRVYLPETKADAPTDYQSQNLPTVILFRNIAKHLRNINLLYIKLMCHVGYKNYL